MNPNSDQNPMTPSSKSNKVIYWIIIAIIAVIVIVWAIMYSAKSSTETAMQPGTENTTGTTQDNTTTGAGSNTGKVPANETQLTDDQVLQIIRSASIKVPGTGVEVALTNGTAAFTEGSTKGTVQLGKVIGKVYTNDGYDVYADLTVKNNATASIIHYVALFNVKAQTALFTSALSIGDRVVITKTVPLTKQAAPLSTKQGDYIDNETGYTLTIYYMDHQTGTSLDKAPTIAKDITISVKDHMLFR